MRTLLPGTLLLLLVAQGAFAQVQPAADPVLAGLIGETLARLPELKQAEALLRAEAERVPQAGALQDPVLSLGIQNDGFKAIQIGSMETSYLQIMVTQALPWPGKRDLRGAVAASGVKLAEASLDRARLTAEADVRRGYLELLLVRDRLALLTKLEALWTKAEALARIRYESSGGAQSDILRAQLERNRLRQRRWSLEAEEKVRAQALNRLRGQELLSPLPTQATIAGLGLPEVPEVAAALADAEQRSPELRLSRLLEGRAQQQVELSRRERYPDFAVTAGIMPRGGLEPMWLASVSVGLPIFSGQKQSRAIAESEARAEAQSGGAAALLQLLRLRVQERHALLGSLVESARIYRDGLLIQSQATADSTLSQYRVGRSTFASALEAIGGVIGDEDGYLAAVVAAHRVAIANAEVSLSPSGGGAGGSSGASIPGAGASGPGSGSGSAGAAAPAGGEVSGAASGAAPMTKM